MAKRAAKRSDSDSIKADALKKKGKKWLERIEAAWKREETWAKDAEAAVKAYTNEAANSVHGKLYDYNIFHANVETIVPAIINSPPVPDVRRRFGDTDEVARMLSDIIERAITVQVDDSRLQTELEGQAQDGFMAGRGVVRLRFHADTLPTETNALEEAKDEADPNPDEGGSRDDRPDEYGGVQEAAVGDAAGLYAGASAFGASEGNFGQPQVANERITFEAVSWRDYQHGPATRWEDRPWESYRHVMLAEDVKDFADQNYATLQTEPGGSLYSDMSGDVVIYEIWDKKHKKVCFIDDTGKYLKEIDDPLGLTQFFPAATPVQPIELVGRLMPVVPFSIYKKLADELDIITKRIRVLTDAMRIKGGVLGIAASLTALAEAEDNQLIPLENIEQLAQTPGGLENAVLWWPVDRFFQVLAELFKNRDLTKQAIYEITGISDVVRGASKASETLGAQQIKTQWGALRIQKMQRMMERSARDLFVMMSEIIPAKFSHETLERMTGIPILLRPTDTPEQIQQKQQLHALMAERVSTYYRVDVESESTIRADLTMKKQEAGTFLDASAKYFAAVGPLVQLGQLPAEAAIEVYAANARLFNLGKSTEDVLEGMVKQAKEAAKNPQPPQPTPEQQALQAEQQREDQRFQNEMQLKQREADDKAADREAERAMKAEEHQFKMAEMQTEAGLRQLEAQERQADRQFQREANSEKVGFEREKQGFAREAHQQAMQVKTADSDGKALAAGMPPTAAWDKMAGAHQETASILAKALADDAQNDARLAEVLGQLAAAMKSLAENAAKPRTIQTPRGKYTATVN